MSGALTWKTPADARGPGEKHEARAGWRAPGLRASPSVRHEGTAHLSGFTEIPAALEAGVTEGSVTQSDTGASAALDRGLSRACCP